MRRASRDLLSALALTLLLACGSDKSDRGGSGGQGATGGSDATGGGGSQGGTLGTGGGGGQATGAAGQGGGSFGMGGLAGASGAGAASDGGAGHPQGGKGGQGGVGTAGSGGGESPCATASAGQTCNGEGLTCGTCPSACQNCALLRCSQGHWQMQEAFAAPCFSCGPTLRCQKTATYCHVVGGTPTYSCTPTPASCLPTPTCACLKGFAGGTCEDKTGGDITITLGSP